MLVVHGTGDGLFDPEMARAIHAAAPEPRRLALLDGFDHTAAWERASAEFWRPVIEFVRRDSATVANP